MKISLFDNIHNTLPSTVETDWDDFAHDLGPHRMDLDAKDAYPGFSPAEWGQGARRSKKGVQRVHFGVLDLDKLADEKLDELMPLLEGLKYIFYTTWSHVALQQRGLWAARLVVAFSRPVLASEWALFWPRFNHRFGDMGDPSCRDPSRLYYVPSAPAGSNGQSYYDTGDGAPLNVDALMHEQLPIDLDTPEMVKIEHVRDFAKRIQRRKSTYHKQMGARLVQMLDGRPFAEEGERDDVIFKLSCLLVEEWPRARSSALADLFSVSLAVMRDLSPSCPSQESVEEKIRRHQSAVLEEMQHHEMDELASRKRLLRAALGREYPYTDAELQSFATDADVTAYDFQKRWIIQRDKSYYVFKAGTYCDPVSRWEVLESVERDLAPATTAGVELMTVNIQGQLMPKGPTLLMREYGQVARHVVADMTAQYSRFDAATETMFEAPCPERDIEPRFVPEVDEWIHALAGEKVEKVLDWMAVVTALEEPCAALYFEGPPGCGKTLFADALARVWTTQGPSTLDQALGKFNSALVGCPLVLADETLGGNRSSELRQFIQARTRPLRRKFIPDATLHGCIRMVVTANNRDLLNSQENLSTDDIRAIIDRLFYVECSVDGTTYLQGLEHQLLTDFVQADLVAAHALHLRDTRVVARGARFLVAGEDSTLHRSLTTSAGLRSAVCHWLVSYLLESPKVDAQGTKLVRIYKGRVFATTRGLIKHWLIYETNEDPPPAGPLSKALSGLSDPGKHQLTAGDGKRTNYWVLSTDNLLTWADNNGYADVDELRDILLTDTPD